MEADIYVYAPDLTVADGTITPVKFASSVYGLVGEVSALGSVSAGSSVRVSRADHVHPTTGLAVLASANTFTAQQTITPATSVTALVVNGGASSATTLQVNPSAGSIGLVIKAGDTATEIMRIRNTGDSATLFGISDSGKITVGSGGGIGSPIAMVSVNPNGDSTVGVAIKARSTQTGNLQEWQNNSGTVLTNITSAGGIETTQGMRFYTSSARTGWGTLTNSGGDLFYNYALTVGSTSGKLGSLTVYPTITTQVGAVIRGASGQTADLQQWQSSTPTTLAAVSSNGALRAPFYSSITTGKAYLESNLDTGSMGVQTGDPANKGLTVRANTAQTANLQEWQSSAGASGILASVSSSGQLSLSPSSGTALTVNAVSSGIGLVVKANATTPGNIQEWWRDGATGATTWIASNGLMQINAPSGSIGGVLGVNSNSDTFRGIVVRGNGAAGSYTQTADLQQWSSYDGTTTTVRSKVDAAGAFTISPSSGTALTVNGAASVATMVVKGVSGQNIAEFWAAGSGGADTSIRSDSGIQINASAIGGSVGGLLGVRANAASRGLVIRANTSQTADLVQIVDANAAVLGGRNALAQIYSGSTAPVTVATGGAISGTSSGTTATLTSASAHGLAVGDIVTLVGITPSGYNGTYLVATVPTTTSFTVTTSGSNLGNTTVSGTASVPAQASITARSAGTIALQLRAAASQVANIVRVEDNGGTTLLRLTSAGNLQVNNLMTINSHFVAGEANAGAQVTMTRQTAAAGNPGANIGRLYFRDGTNANTLRLCVRAGANGAEQTILDNIPT